MSMALPRHALGSVTLHEFRAMGCRIEVQLVHDGGSDTAREVAMALAGIEAQFAAYEAALSRFLPTSELSTLNRAAGAGPFLASPLLRAITGDALAASAATNGMFDPTLATVLAHLGYDRPFPLLDTLADGALPVYIPPHRADAWRDVIVDDLAETITLPADVALDFGGIGKGWTVDRVVAWLRETPGVLGGLVNAGGDLRVWGAAPEEDPAWTVGVEDPRDLDADCALLAVNDAAIATSSTAYRRWRRGDRWVHHLLDPRTGKPAVTKIAAVTAIGPSAAWAEVHAKVALLHGAADGRAYLEAQRGYAGLLITADGDHIPTSGMERYLT